MKLRLVADDCILEGTARAILRQMRDRVPFQTFPTNGAHRAFLASQASRLENVELRSENNQVLIADMLSAGLAELLPPLDDEALAILRLLPPSSPL